MPTESKICGKVAVELLKSRTSLVRLHKKDNTDKLWSYKCVSGKHAEFAFDPKTTTKLNVWFDREVPDSAGAIKDSQFNSKSSSTALARVFSGRSHVARAKYQILDEGSLLRIITALNES